MNAGDTHLNELEEQRHAAAEKLVQQGRELLDQGKVEESLRVFDQATGVDPMNASAWNDLAVALHQVGRAEDAIGCLYTALRVDPSFADAAVNLATLLESAGRRADGIPGLRSVLFHDASHEDVRAMLESMGVTKPRQVAIVAAAADSDAFKVIEACLAEWNYLAIASEDDLVSAFGSFEKGQTWLDYVAALRPAAIIVDPEHHHAKPLEKAAAYYEATVARLGHELPDGTPLVDLARALTTEVPSARDTWVGIPRPAPPLTVAVSVTRVVDAINICDRLTYQSLPPGAYEVIMVDRAWGEPATSMLESSELGFNLRIIRMEGAGLGEAHQALTDAARGQWTVFFAEETRPSPDNLMAHLKAQVSSWKRKAVLGNMRLHNNLVENSFRKLLDSSDTLWHQPGLETGAILSGAMFTTDNVSLPTEVIREAGGFDSTFAFGGHDTDFGLRMERLTDVHIALDKTIGAEYDHPYSVRDLMDDYAIQGWSCYHLAQKYGEPRFLINPRDEQLNDAWYAQNRAEAEEREAQALDLAKRLVDVCTIEEPYRRTGAVEHMEPLVQVIGAQAFQRGVAIAHAGFNVQDAYAHEHLDAVPTPVVVRPGGDVKATLESLAAAGGAIVAYVDEAVDAPAGLVVERGQFEAAFASGAPVIGWVDSGEAVEAGWRDALVAQMKRWPDHGVVIAPAEASAAFNRPTPPAYGLAHRAILEHFGANALAAADRNEVMNKASKLGFQTIVFEEQVEDAPAEQALESVG